MRKQYAMSMYASLEDLLKDKCSDQAKRIAELEAVIQEALKALENLENDNGSIPDHAWQMVQAAIAKAKP